MLNKALLRLYYLLGWRWRWGVSRKLADVPVGDMEKVGVVPPSFY